MTILIALPVAALRVQYTIARYPLQLIEAQLGTWLPSQAPVRLIYERGFGLLDRTAGRVLGDGDLERRGAALIERSGALARAEKLDAQAARIESRAEDELASKREDTRDNSTPPSSRSSRLARTPAEQAQNREDAARRQAQQEEKAAKEHADQVAARRVQAAKATRSSEQSRIRDAERPDGRTRASRTGRRGGCTQTQPPPNAPTPTGSRNWPTPQRPTAATAHRQPMAPPPRVGRVRGPRNSSVGGDVSVVDPFGFHCAPG